MEKAWYCVCVVLCESVRMHAYRELYILEIEKDYVSRNRQESGTCYTINYTHINPLLFVQRKRVQQKE